MPTEQRIIEAAILVFNEDYSASLERVAEQAAVTRRTLHRYFTGREALLTRCEQEMRRSCNQALAVALDSSDDPVTQLERMVYAGVDCGAKYSFLSKLHAQPTHQHSPHNPDCAAYDALCGRLRALVLRLQGQGVISGHLTAEWVLLLFNGVLVATVNAAAGGSVARTSLKQFAWFSFSKGIGL